MSCFCCSNLPFNQCCQPIIEQQTLAQTPLQLMRSRFSAYASGNAEYILNTYALEKRKQHTLTEISEWSNECKWLKLIIHQSSNVAIEAFESADNSTVTFTAIYRQGNHYFQMKELSRFVVEKHQWVYLDGDILIHDELVVPKRNDQCLCGSKQKFKKCCGK
ncbi:YchJ family protein [Thalassotalea fusca]